jgi:hypothetical protein
MGAGVAIGFLLAVAATVTGTGCAFTDEQLRTPAPAQVATGSRRGAGRRLAVMVPFKDQRSEHRCGMKKNGYNMDTAALHCVQAPPQFVSALFVHELRAAGFDVTTNPQPADPTVPLVRGVLRQLFVEPRLVYFGATMEADVAVTLDVQMPGGVTATRNFYVKGTEATILAGREDAEAAEASAVRELMLDAVGAIANLLDRPPAP